LADVIEDVEEEEAVEEEEEEASDAEEIPAPPPATQWEEMHDIYFKKPVLFSRNINSSIESLRDDEEDCALNLSNMYGESFESHSNEKRKSVEDDTLDVIDDLIKSFEKEVEMSLEAVPIVNVENE
jgi:hypothetical protein